MSGRGCKKEDCNHKHHAMGFCKLHYKMPSQMNPKGIKRTYTKRKPKVQKEETLPQLIERTQKVFNAAIRKRDSHSDGTFKCISCGLWKSTKEMDAGHFFPVRHSILRFNEDNVHGECISCNRFDDNHLIGYKTNLINIIGLEQFNWLYKIRNVSVKWDRAVLLEIIDKYK